VKAGPGEDPRNCIPLCRHHHTLFDGGQLDIIPYLDRGHEEAAYAVSLVGLGEAYVRLGNDRF
jgi:predicted restriction endonuclease